MFVIDEASMVPLHALAAIDRMLRDITSTDVPFGGKIFLMGGDFARYCQLYQGIQEQSLLRTALSVHLFGQILLYID